MKFNDIIKLSTNNLSHRGLRSWLTILGIIIGVGAVVAILSIGGGMEQSISAQLGGLGADVVTVSPGFSRASGMGFAGRMEQQTTGGRTVIRRTEGESHYLTDRDIQIIKSVSGVKIVNAIVSGNADVSYLAEKTSASIQGVDPSTWEEIITYELEDGRYLMSGDGNVVVLGNGIANDRFKQPLILDTQINIGGKSFRIVGILESSGGIGGFGGSDNTIFMPISAARTLIDNVGTDKFSSILVKVSDPDVVDEIVTNIEKSLMLSRHVTENTKDFTVTSAKAMLERISEVMGTVNLFLGGIAAVSLLVGAIGIANTMFMSVMERTRQIGTLKALGTTNFEIMKLFLFESGMIGFIGGLMGIFLGFISSGVISEIGVRTLGLGEGMRGMGGGVTLITPQLVLFAMGFSVFIGIISGLFPARRAASLQPVEALRYE